jgi:DNA-directed RNA polymerase subunit alpha
MAGQQYEKALEKYQEAKTAGYDADQCAIASAETHRLRGEVQKAMDILDQLFGPIEQTAEYLYQRGATVAAVGGNPTEVVALYERAVEANPRHPGALFGLALENDRRGNDVIAIELYQRSTQCFPAHIGALINLGVLYEDREEYQRAANCYERVLASYPDHPRARLFQKDAAEAAEGCEVDTASIKQGEQLEVVLNTPVTEFEMSVRARNCLRAMGIRTLGDLTRVTEQELLSSKNFGETSLDEIREIMVSKQLKLGQNADKRPEQDAVVDTSSMSPDEQALLSRPISELELSVRARKCMVRLGMTSIGELIRKTGDDLLECKNFGVTSLNEVKEKLAQYNLKLRGE